MEHQLKEHVKSSIASVEARYEKFRNVTNNTAIFIADNKKLKADNLKLIHEVCIFNFPIFKSANELTFAIVDGFNNMRSIYIVNTKWWSDFQFFIDIVARGPPKKPTS
jgi:hypothetical protein